MQEGCNGPCKGAVVALEPSTGKILAMVSSPSYDPNLLATHDADQQGKAAEMKQRLMELYFRDGGDLTDVNVLVQAAADEWKVPAAECTVARSVITHTPSNRSTTFGKVAGSVSADWGPGDYGGMEHHPYWHVGKNDFKDEVTHVHEAVHGWFGDGVRIDDVLLEAASATCRGAQGAVDPLFSSGFE